MMKLAVIGDVHANFKNLSEVLEYIPEEGCSGILLVGDIGANLFERGAPIDCKAKGLYLRSVERVLNRVSDLSLPYAYVPGNHDLKSLSLSGNCDGNLLGVGGFSVFGIGGAGPARFGFPYEWDEVDIEKIDVPDCDVILSHAPPIGTLLDVVAGKASYAGSSAIRAKLDNHSGFFVCGHIHESVAIEVVGKSLCFNVGALGHPYGKAQVGFLIEEEWERKAIHVNLSEGKRTEYAVWKIPQ